jgi:hypothetical protein
MFPSGNSFKTGGSVDNHVGEKLQHQPFVVFWPFLYHSSFKRVQTTSKRTAKTVWRHPESNRDRNGLERPLELFKAQVSTTLRAAITPCHLGCTIQAVFEVQYINKVIFLRPRMQALSGSESGCEEIFAGVRARRVDVWKPISFRFPGCESRLRDRKI